MAACTSRPVIVLKEAFHKSLVQLSTLSLLHENHLTTSLITWVMGSFFHRILDVMEYFVSWNPGAHGIHDILKSMISWNPWSSGILESWNPWYIPNGNWLHVKAQWSYAVICLLIHHWAILEILDDNGKKMISDPIGCFIEWWHLKINSLF